jgi:hypothetical protein
MGGSFHPEQVAGFTGMGGRFAPEYAGSYGGLGRVQEKVVECELSTTFTTSLFRYLC